MTSTINVYYRPADGEIHSWDNGLPVEKPGLSVTRILLPDGHSFSPDVAVHRVDPETGDLVDKTPLEREIVARPTIDEIRAARLAALSVSDAMMLSDRDLSENAFAAWRDYRKALRDLTKDASGRARTAMEMFDAFPVAPDGTDAVWLFRKRMEMA